MGLVVILHLLELQAAPLVKVDPLSNVAALRSFNRIGNLMKQTLKIT